MKTVTIKRSEWLRNGRVLEVNTYMWDLDSGKGCCLGHVFHQAFGYTKKEMNKLPTPLACVRQRHNLYSHNQGDWGDIDQADKPLCDTASPTHLKATDIAMHINDQEDVSDEVREAEIQKSLRTLGIDVIFVD